MPIEYRLFDSHLHIIDPRFPLVTNNGYLPEAFTCSDYLDRMSAYRLYGGAVVSGSFQGIDQCYLRDALSRLGPTFVGVSQVPISVSNDEILELNECGVRAIRFNLVRGGFDQVRYLSSMAARVYEVAGWHVELYIDSADLPELYPKLVELPRVSIDHMGLSRTSFATLLNLAEKGVRVKASGFGRVDFPVKDALRALYAANPQSLMFGTDLPSTRAATRYTDDDYSLVIETLGEQGAERVFLENALNFYRLEDGMDPSSRRG